MNTAVVASHGAYAVCLSEPATFAQHYHALHAQNEYEVATAAQGLRILANAFMHRAPLIHELTHTPTTLLFNTAIHCSSKGTFFYDAPDCEEHLVRQPDLCALEARLAHSLPSGTRLSDDGEVRFVPASLSYQRQEITGRLKGHPYLDALSGDPDLLPSLRNSLTSAGFRLRTFVPHRRMDSHPHIAQLSFFPSGYVDFYGGNTAQDDKGRVLILVT